MQADNYEKVFSHMKPFLGFLMDSFLVIYSPWDLIFPRISVLLQFVPREWVHL